MDSTAYVHFSRAVSLAIFIVGAFSCSAILASDELGRVNLIHYILLFCVVPVVSLIVMIAGGLKGSNKTHVVTQSILRLPLWPRHWSAQIQQLKQQQLFMPWLNYLSQLVGLSFALGCLFSFILILLFSDVAFVWRSTLLTAEHIYPWLQALAYPWQFIESAQPVKETLLLTQESRFSGQTQATVDYGHWWQFLLVAQLFYGVVPRFFAMSWTHFRFKSAIARQKVQQESLSPLINQTPATPSLAPTMNERPQLTDYNVVCWLAMEPQMLQRAITHFNTPSKVYQAGFHGEDEAAALADKKIKLVLVAAWEPPLGELKDFLEQGHGVIMPIDFNGEQWQTIAPHYLDEWRRFAQSLEQWEIFVEKELV